MDIYTVEQVNDIQFGNTEALLWPNSVVVVSVSLELNYEYV
jgi:hypothetical protein